MKKVLLTIVAVLALAIAGCGDDSSTTDTASTSPTTEEQQSPTTEEQPADDATSESSEQKTKPKVTVPSGPPPKSELISKELEEGTGAAAKAGDEVTVQYVGVGYRSGSEFDSSWSRSEPFTFNLGAGEVIPGWDQGIQGMKVGGRRELIIPPELAYGPEGFPPAIGKNEALIFVVDLEAVK